MTDRVCGSDSDSIPCIAVDDGLTAPLSLPLSLPPARPPDPGTIVALPSSSSIMSTASL